MLARTQCQSSLLKSRIDMLGNRLNELEAMAKTLKAELAELTGKLATPSTTNIITVPKFLSEPIKTTPRVVQKKTGKPPKLLKKQIVPPPVDTGRKRGRPFGSKNRTPIEKLQHDAHVKRFRKIMYMREYMRLRKAQQLEGVSNVA
jgi:hypothetical protein